jgi:predicted alpha/beta hydrolase family esterase
MRAGALASIWGSQLVVYRNAGHINAESGFGPWPQGLTHVHELASRAGRHRSSAPTANPVAN